MFSKGTELFGKAIPASGTPNILRTEDTYFGWHVPCAQQTLYPVGKGKNRV